ncbi:hypothetical protein B0H10DRAFT_1959617 [Mycena sp. CBHHK59/15]|nr:hypothetical protein B0H10DRAFT_2236626 [Mycena sp. CBHHK59/15]KAJ6597929.1 hypothetical protein B0H10DRAFT_1959617 [Mycena sp. CBHHK59/15]
MPPSLLPTRKRNAPPSFDGGPKPQRRRISANRAVSEGDHLQDVSGTSMSKTAAKMLTPETLGLKEYLGEEAADAARANRPNHLYLAVYLKGRETAPRDASELKSPRAQAIAAKVVTKVQMRVVPSIPGSYMQRRRAQQELRAAAVAEMMRSGFAAPISDTDPDA